MTYDAAAQTLVVESGGAILVVDPTTGMLEYSVAAPTAVAGQDGTIVLDPTTDEVWVD